MSMAYYARPNGRDGFEQWWGRGGAELWDTIDDGCVTEEAANVWIGPFSARLAGLFDHHAREIPGYHVPGKGYAIVWRQGGGQVERAERRPCVCCNLLAVKRLG